MDQELQDGVPGAGAARDAVKAKQAALIDSILASEELKNDAALSRLIEVSPPVISKLRHGRLVIGAGVLQAISETTGRSTIDMKRFLGLRVAGDPLPGTQAGAGE